ncbi:MAG: 3-deoxy-7-phosphoheptulonate synthase class II [Phycisphaerales bacterium]
MPDALNNWRAEGWRDRPWAWAVHYPDHAALTRAEKRLAEFPPLVTSGEIERLRTFLAEAEEGKRFYLQGGDCAETLADCTPDVITAKLKILLQMSLVLVYAGKMPVVRIGRLAGQYSKPRSSATETRTVDGREVTLPSYFGDLVNKSAFTADARRPDPDLMVQGYQHAAVTLNFIRSLLDAGFGAVNHPENWDLSFLKHAGLHDQTRARYQTLVDRIGEGLKFMSALVDAERNDSLRRAEFFTSHEGLNLYYEQAQTRTVPRRTGHYNLTTHLPWIGDRTRALDGPHVEFFRGVRNPLGVKIGAGITPDELLRLVARLNPANEGGKVVLTPRLGANNVERVLPALVQSVQRAGLKVLWVCDPMHGNGLTTDNGTKTRSFDDILRELLLSWDVHRAHGSRLGGVHVELTGEDVTECIGGAGGMNEEHLSRNYASLCDPRLNYEQALELAFALADKMQG